MRRNDQDRDKDGTVSWWEWLVFANHMLAVISGSVDPNQHKNSYCMACVAADRATAQLKMLDLPEEFRAVLLMETQSNLARASDHPDPALGRTAVLVDDQLECLLAALRRPLFKGGSTLQPLLPPTEQQGESSTPLHAALVPTATDIRRHIKTSTLSLFTELADSSRNTDSMAIHEALHDQIREYEKVRDDGTSMITSRSAVYR